MHEAKGAPWGIAWYLALVLLLSPAPGMTLRCLQCEDCGLSVGDPTTCRAGHNMCMKLQSRGRMERTCGTHEACGYGVAERWGRRLWRHVKGLVSDWEGDEDASEVFCCASDFCNDASSRDHTTAAYVSLTLSCVIYIYWNYLQ